MKVFISWSGVRSKAVAQTLRTWLKDVMQALDPWISVEDIDKGQQWGHSLAGQLESTHAGVICVTPENLTAPWLLFEAGALSKLYTEARVCTYLIDMPYANVPLGPLSGFQHTVATKEDTHRMVQSLNAAIPEGQGRLTEPQLSRAFDRCWPELQQCLGTLPAPQEDIPPPRTVEDMLQEILEIVRRPSIPLEDKKLQELLLLPTETLWKARPDRITLAEFLSKMPAEFMFMLLRTQHPDLLRQYLARMRTEDSDEVEGVT